MRSLCLIFLASISWAQSPGPNDKVFSLNFAGSPQFQQCGTITRQAPNLLENISPACLQSAYNLYFDSDGSLDRRGGIAQYNLTPISGTQTVKGLWPFNSTNGIKYLIAFSSSSMFYTTGDGNWSMINPSGSGYWGLSTTAEMQCVQSAGFLWCTDGTDQPFQTNVTSTQAIAAAPIGSLIGTFRNRILISGVSGSLTDVYLSGELNGLDWAVPAVTYSTSAAIISLNGVNDGLQPNCLMGEFQNQYYIGRDYDLWALSGYSNQDFALRKVSSEIGCTDPKSVQEVNKQLIWLSKRGVEALSGTQITPISYYIRPTINQLIAAAGNARSQLINGNNFSTGQFCASGPNSCTSSTISPGFVVPSSWSVTDTSFASPGYSFGSLVNVSTNDITGSIVLLRSTWSMTNGSFSLGNTTNWTAVNMQFGADFNGGGCQSLEGTQTKFGEDSGRGGQVGLVSSTVTVNDANGSLIKRCYIEWDSTHMLYISDTCDLSFSTGTANASFGVCRDLGLNIANPQNYNGMSIKFTSMLGATMTSAVAPPANQVWVNTCILLSGTQEINGFSACGTSNYMSSGTYATSSYFTAISTPVWGDFNINMSSASNTPATFKTLVSANNSTFDAGVTATPGSQIASAAKSYIKYIGSLSQSIALSTGTPVISLDNLAAETTGYYISPAILVSSPTSWGTFQVDGVTNGGLFTFWISTGATAALATASTAPWVMQSPNAQIGVSTTTTYVAVRILFSLSVATQVPTINDFTVNWNNGSNRPPTSSMQYYDRYYLFYTTNTIGSPVNDHAAVYDYNGKWTFLDHINAYSATLYLNAPYIGDSNSTGLVYQMESGQSDNGKSFTYQWQTGDIDLGNPAQRKTFKRLYLYLNGPITASNNTSLSCQYQLDGSATTYPLSSAALQESPESTGYFVAKFPFPAPPQQAATGHWINISCSSFENSSALKVYGASLVWEPQSWD